MAKTQKVQHPTAIIPPKSKLPSLPDWVMPSSAEDKIWKYIFIAIAVILFCVRPVLSYQFGPSSDETYHRVIGDLSYDYLASFGTNDSIFKYHGNGREDAALLLNYGPLLEVIPAAIYKNFGTDPFPTRHCVITIFTFLLFFYAGLTAKKIGGWRAGVIGMCFMALAPRLFGEAFNNPKDPPFAAAYMMAIYYLICFLEEVPKPSWRNTLLLMLGIGLALAIRVGGLLLFAYLGLFLFLTILTQEVLRKEFLSLNFKFYKDVLIKLAVVVTGAWIIGIIAWPAALRAPISHPFYALKVQSEYPTVIRVLFGGEYIPSNEVPWNYNPTYISITTPAITLIGLALALAFGVYMRKFYKMSAIYILLFISLFPLFYIVYKKSALLNGWRHSYFTFTGLCVLAALGFEAFFRWIKKDNMRWIGYAFLILGMCLPLSFMARNFPMVYTYMNEFVGGVDGTYAQYQLDYYACSAKPAADWMAKNIPYKEGLKIVSNNPWELNECWISQKSKFTSSYIRYRERFDQDWDYAVFLPQFVDPAIMKKGFFAPKGTIHEIKVDNSVVACIVKRENRDDLHGIEALKKGDFANAIPLLESALKYSNTNDVAWSYLGLAYANVGRQKEALNALSAALNISPENQMATNFYQQIAGNQNR